MSMKRVSHALRTDDEELLELAVEWLAFSLFQQKAMRMTQVRDPAKAGHWVRGMRQRSSPA